jgi:hypothetical protein
MTTTNPKLQGYILPNLHQRFSAWKKERHLEKDSQALNILLGEFFGEAVPAVETVDSLRLQILEDTVKNLSQQLEAVTQTVAAIQSTGKLPSDSLQSTSLGHASNKSVSTSESQLIQSELPLLEFQNYQGISASKAPDESVSDSLRDLSSEQLEVTDSSNESAIAPAPTSQFANPEETLAPSETIGSENLGIETVAESSQINHISKLPDELPSNSLKADVQDSSSVISSESSTESLAAPPSEQSEVTGQTSESVIAHLEEKLPIIDAINSVSLDLDTATEPSRANTQGDLPNELLDESPKIDVQDSQVVNLSESPNKLLDDEPVNEIQVDIAQSSESLTTTQLALLIGVGDRAVGVAASQGHEYFQEWSTRKGKGTWDFRVLNSSSKRVKREFFKPS